MQGQLLHFAVNRRAHGHVLAGTVGLDQLLRQRHRRAVRLGQLPCLGQAEVGFQAVAAAAGFGNAGSRLGQLEGLDPALLFDLDQLLLGLQPGQPGSGPGFQQGAPGGLGFGQQRDHPVQLADGGGDLCLLCLAAADLVINLRQLGRMVADLGHQQVALPVDKGGFGPGRGLERRKGRLQGHGPKQRPQPGCRDLCFGQFLGNPFAVRADLRRIEPDQDIPGGHRLAVFHQD